MSFLNLMRNRLKPKEVNDALMEVEDKILPATTSATTGQILGLTGENKIPAWVDNSSLPATTSANAGDVLGLVGENKEKKWIAPYSPPAYSTSEVDSGLKWIDGRVIYQKTFTGTAGTSSTTLQSAEGIELIKAEAFIYKTSGDSKLGVSLGGITDSTTWTLAVHVDSSNNVCLMTGTDTNGGDYVVTIYYVKVNPISTLTKKRKTVN